MTPKETKKKRLNGFDWTWIGRSTTRKESNQRYVLPVYYTVLTMVTQRLPLSPVQHRSSSVSSSSTTVPSSGSKPTTPLSASFSTNLSSSKRERRIGHRLR